MGDFMNPYRFFICLTLWVSFCWSPPLSAETDPAGPMLNKGEKWRIAYVEGGPYANYQNILSAVIQHLMATGWIETKKLPEPEDESETRTLWQFLSQQAKSRYLDFLSDAGWTSDWDDQQRKANKALILKRLQTPGDIDLLLAFGTWSGQDFANDLHQTPVMVLSASNAVRSGIIKSVEDSGYDHVHAYVDPTKSIRQIRLFHEVIRFKKLGLAYEDDVDGRSYAAVDDVRALADELGFKVVSCKLSLNTSGTREEEVELIKCYQKLAPDIDALFITDYAGLNKNSIQSLLAPLFTYNVPTFAQTRFDLVQHGILMGANRRDFSEDARHYTRTMIRILKGETPRTISQVFESPLSVVVNLETAKRIGVRIPIDILAGASRIHETIVEPDTIK